MPRIQAQLLVGYHITCISGHKSEHTKWRQNGYVLAYIVQIFPIKTAQSEHHVSAKWLIDSL